MGSYVGNGRKPGTARNETRIVGDKPKPGPAADDSRIAEGGTAKSPLKAGKIIGNG